MRLWICWCGVLCGLSLCMVAAGCGPTAEQKKAAEEAKKPAEVKLGESTAPPDEDDEPKAPSKDKKENKKEGEEKGVGATTDLKVGDGKLTFLVPASWKKVQPATQIIEAEFNLPKAAGNEFDGRLTLMAAGGGLDDNIQRWEKEFTGGTLRDTKKETSTVAGKTATWVDLRGEWTGNAMRPVPARKDYRMLSVVIPLDGGHSYFIKLTGPRETLAAHEEEFRSFVNSAKLASDK